MDFAVSRSQSPGGSAVVTVQGDVDFTNAHQVRQAIVDAIDEWRPAAVHVDLGLVHYLDSMGISSLIAGLRAATVSGAAFRVVNPSRPAMSVLDVCGLREVFGYGPPVDPSVPPVTIEVPPALPIADIATPDGAAPDAPRSP
jgi:anti-anti-sigma factor